MLKDRRWMAEGMARTYRLDRQGRITVHPGYRHILDGPIEQRETEEGILLRPAPRLPKKQQGP